MEFTLHVQGDRACFKRVEFAEDLVSYDVITPMAARGIFGGVHAAPDFTWRVREIRVLRPIRSTWMSLAETAAGAGPAPARIVGGRRDRRMANVLTDVDYAITAAIEPRPAAGRRGSADEHAALFRDRIARRLFQRPIYLGLRDFAAALDLIEPGAPPPPATAPPGRVDLGWMLHDVPDDGSAGPRFFRATMIDGAIDLRRRDALILAG